MDIEWFPISHLKSFIQQAVKEKVSILLTGIFFFSGDMAEKTRLLLLTGPTGFETGLVLSAMTASASLLLVRKEPRCC
jgi:hypothetical protein